MREELELAQTLAQDVTTAYQTLKAMILIQQEHWGMTEGESTILIASGRSENIWAKQIHVLAIYEQECTMLML